MASIGELSAKADALRALHYGGTPLVLPNAWDVASARVFADAGFPAIATTSGGVAAALGYPDGEVIPFADMFDTVGRIAHAVDVPVTADLEAGYGLSSESLISLMIEAGVVGMNSEDTNHPTRALRPVAEQADRLRAMKEAGREAGVEMVLNARVDAYLREGSPDGQLAEALERAHAYARAGADCIFPIFCRKLDAIAALVRGAGAPSTSCARSACRESRSAPACCARRWRERRRLLLDFAAAASPGSECQLRRIRPPVRIPTPDSPPAAAFNFKLGRPAAPAGRPARKMPASPQRVAPPGPEGRTVRSRPGGTQSPEMPQSAGLS